ncbi:hypothetical protein QJS66_19005 [Kocuria rhizophila]|nr:hypothetical protein QJS66_19005 [Kocuria rhizophila]
MEFVDAEKRYVGLDVHYDPGRIPAFISSGGVHRAHHEPVHRAPPGVGVGRGDRGRPRGAVYCSGVWPAGAWRGPPPGRGSRNDSLSVDVIVGGPRRAGVPPGSVG